MACQRCGVVSPEGKRFCGDCGASLDPRIDQMIRQEVQAVLQEQLKDQKLLAIQIADDAAARFGFYAKIVGIPLTLVLLILAFFGFRTYQDANRVIQKTRQEVVQTLTEHAAQGVKLLNKETDAAVGRLRKQESEQNIPQQFAQARNQLGQIRSNLAAVQQEAQRYQSEYAGLRRWVSSLRVAGDPISGLGVTSQPIGLTTNSLISQNMPQYSEYKVGSEGRDVERIQERLKALGCYQGDVTAKFDQATSDAVIRFNEAKAKEQERSRILVGSLGTSLRASPVTIPRLGTSVAPNGVVDFLTWYDLVSNPIATPCR